MIPQDLLKFSMGRYLKKKIIVVNNLNKIYPPASVILCANNETLNSGSGNTLTPNLINDGTMPRIDFFLYLLTLIFHYFLKS